MRLPSRGRPARGDALHDSHDFHRHDIPFADPWPSLPRRASCWWDGGDRRNSCEIRSPTRRLTWPC